ncbi:type VI secretion system Vgr family protein [Sorangium cellulosum]|uniref:Gp5/Type VI secretion system Vgr C-terminal trimerisation domain-containing protein n=1 Tax=Sorangium cellulosum So0157-2 TaxID=1254432 RepID=S4XVE8_SORCE|nr:type VI secretion system tip protein TssI/VgrG [Sorangium cellulosum]AGP36444.1 hypothetical protein SCE1572_19280 [Sorangium cellulosum So0157-2]
MSQLLDVTLACTGLQGDLLVAEATVHEAISRPTRAVVHALAFEDIDGEPAIGTPAHLQISIDGEPVRHFHLVVVGFRFEGIYEGNKRRYAIELAHEFWLLSLRSDVRIFQEKDAKEIVAEVLHGGGVVPGHVAFSVRRPLAKRTYCVQYRETDLAFASRLLEHEGIFYFAHDDASSTRVTFADAQSAFPPIDGEAAIRFDDDAHGPGIHEFALETRAVASKVTLGDYNYMTPGVELHMDHARPGGAGDLFEYTAGYETQGEGEALAQIRLEELLAQETVGHGRSDRLTLRAGAWFELEEPSRDALAGKYLICSVEHQIRPYAHEERALDSYYENRFTCIPHAAQFRPPRETPRARVAGLHSAVVTGPGGEIHTDSLGRMKGQLSWDRLGKDSDTSSCWMRVCQLPIGGSMALARVGWEMAIGYFDGDPDRPMAVARLYNAEQTSPYSYPAAKSRMALKTLSSPASGKFNEVRMEDGSGGMEFFANASKDHDAQTNNNKTETVGVDEKVEIGADAQITVGVDQIISIAASDSATISGDAGVNVVADRTKSVGASETVSLGGNLSESVEGSDTEMTGGSHTTLAALGIEKSSTGGFSVTVGGSMVWAAGLDISTMVAGARSETVGGAKISASAASVSESVVGALASTVGGVCVQAAGGNRVGSTKGSAAVTVGGLLAANAAGKVTLKAKKIAIRVLGAANLLGGGGILNMTPGSASFVGLVTLDASGSVKVSGNPNLVG